MIGGLARDEASGQLLRRPTVEVGIEADLLQIELLLDATQRLVADGAAIAQLDQGAVLGGEQVAADGAGGAGVLLDVRSHRARDAAGPALVATAEFVEQLRGDLPPVREVVQVAECRAGADEPGPGFLPFRRVLADESQAADQPWQRQALPDEGDQDHGEGQEEDQIAVGERTALGPGRQGQCGRQGDHAAETGPTDNATLGEGKVGEEAAEEHPGEPERDDARPDDQRIPKQRRDGMRLDPVEDVLEGKPDQDEDETVDDEGAELPDGGRAEPHGRGDRDGSVPAEVESRRDGGEDAGNAELVGGEKSGERRQQRHQPLDAAVVDPAPQPEDEPTDDESDRDAAGADEDELDRRMGEGEGTGDDRADGGPVNDQCGRVVDQALPVQDRDDPRRNAESPRNRAGRDRVGRGDDRPEHEADAPAQVEEIVCDDGDAAGRRDDEPDRERGNRLQIGAKVAPGGGDGVPVEERRQEDEEDDLRIELDLRHTRHEAEGQPPRARAESGTAGPTGSPAGRAPRPLPALPEQTRSRASAIRGRRTEDSVGRCHTVQRVCTFVATPEEARLMEIPSVQNCYLETTGRVTGQPHTIEIWYAARGTTIYLLSGGGDRSDWVKNLQKEPRVRVRIDGRTFAGTGAVIAGMDEEQTARETVVAKYYGWTR